MSYRNKTTGEIISDEDYQALPDGSARPERVLQSEPTGKLNFLKRLKLSFGGSEAQAEQHQLEEQAGLRGKLDIGDIADVAGAALPVAGGILGGSAAAASTLGLGTAGGVAAGTAAGQGVRRVLGGLIGADQPGALDISKDIATTGVMTYLGGKALTSLFNAATKTIPSRLMSIIFKQSADDIAREVQTKGANPVQSLEVLSEGFRGDARKMMVFARETMDSLEEQVQGKVAGSFMKLPAKETKQITNLIEDYISTFRPLQDRYGFKASVIKTGESLIKSLGNVKTYKVPSLLILQARRFIDSVRRTTSFKSNPNLSPLQSVYKDRADFLRTELSKQIPGIDKLMNKYQIHINAFEDLAQYAARTQNKNLFDLIDVFIMYGIDPTAYLARRGLSSAQFLTNTAQGLYQTGQQAQRFVPSGAVPAATTLGAKRVFGNQE